MEDQAEQHQRWWQKNQKLLIITPAVVVVLLFAFVLVVHQLGWDWTGFNGGKTLWDWLQLLIVPFALVGLIHTLVTPGAR